MTYQASSLGHNISTLELSGQKSLFGGRNQAKWTVWYRRCNACHITMCEILISYKFEWLIIIINYLDCLLRCISWTSCIKRTCNHSAFVVICLDIYTIVSTRPYCTIVEKLYNVYMCRMQYAFNLAFIYCNFFFWHGCLDRMWNDFKSRSFYTTSTLVLYLFFIP